MSADEAFIRDNADIISPIPGEAPSELNDSITSVVDGDAEPAVMDLGSKCAAVLDDLRGGGGADFFKDIRRAAPRCLRIMKRGIASATLVPMNCWKLSTYSSRDGKRLAYRGYRNPFWYPSRPVRVRCSCWYQRRRRRRCRHYGKLRKPAAGES